MSDFFSNDDFYAFIRDVPDFPKPGIIFKDITPLVKSPGAFSAVIDLLYQRYREKGIDKIAAIDARGFIFAGALSYKLGVGMIPVRKKGKLPSNKVEVVYDLEYGQDSIEMHSDAISSGEKVLILDDVLATGGTLAAASGLIEKLGGVIEEIAVILELEFLNGREKLNQTSVFSVMKF